MFADKDSDVKSICTSSSSASSRSPSPHTPPQNSPRTDSCEIAGSQEEDNVGKENDSKSRWDGRDLRGWDTLVLEHLSKGSRKARKVGDLIQPARKSFDLIESWLKTKHFPGYPGMVAARDFIAAMDASVKTAYRGIVFANDFVELCRVVQLKSAEDISQFIDEMCEVGKAAHEDAEDTYAKFRRVRRALVHVRQNKAMEDTDNLQASELFQQAVKDIDALLASVHEFASWWYDTTTDIACLKDGLVPRGSYINPIRLDRAKKGWETVRDQYTEYRYEVEMLKEYYPEIPKEPWWSGWFWWFT